MKRSAAFSVGALICAAVAVSVPLYKSAQADELEARDFSRGGYGNTSFSAASFIEEELGFELFAGEREFLSDGGYDILFSDDISPRYMSVQSDGDNVTLQAEKYSYTAVNGKTVEWFPVSANGESLAGGSWSGSSREDFITVEYRTGIDLTQSEADGIANAYYYAAEAAYNKLADEERRYALDCQKYADDSAKYSQYLKGLADYTEQAAKYSEYLKEYAAYQRDYAQYLDYLADYEKYLAELKAYEEFSEEKANIEYQKQLADYLQYLADKNKYADDLAKYESLLQSEDIKKANAQLEILAYINAKAGKDRTLRGAIMGDSVTQVLGKKEELKLAGIEEKALNLADATTRNLRDLITKYLALKDDAQRYFFYVTAYTSLKDNFSDLLRCLDYFYRNDKIKAVIKSKNKEEQYKILLAQLYEISNALDDGAVSNYEKKYKWNHSAAADFGKDYKIDGLSPEEILGDCLLADLGDAQPLEGGYPQLPEKPTPPQEVQFPSPPVRPPKPVTPEPVEMPQRPQEVAEPAEPEFVPQPTEPEEYIPTEKERTLSAAYGNITARQVTSGITINLTKEVKKYFRNITIVTVCFYESKQSAEPVLEVEAELGTYFEYPAEAVPNLQKTGYICLFSHWEYADGTPADFSDLKPEGDYVRLYAVFDEQPIDYPVVWVVDGVAHEAVASFGSIPHFEGTPEKHRDNGRLYRFTGWDKDLAPMPAQKVTYYAEFEESLLITWLLINGQSVTTPVWRGDIPTPPAVGAVDPDSLYTYVFERWDREPQAAYSDSTYTAVFAREYIIPLKNGGALITYYGGAYTADLTTSSANEYKISLIAAIAAENSAGIVLHGSAYELVFSAAEAYALAQSGSDYVKITVNRLRESEYGYKADFGEEGYTGTFIFSVSGVFSGGSFCLLRDKDGGKVTSRFDLQPGRLTFKMNGGAYYEFFPKFDIVLIENPDVRITLGSGFAKRGQTVAVAADSVAEGKILDGIYVFDSYGNKIPVINGTFVMPSSDVVVGAACRLKTYTVTFVADGKVILKASYNYGALPVPPQNPVKAPDGEYSYIFGGWDAEIVPVTKDTVYTAVFQSEALPDFATDGKSPVIKILIIASSVGGAVVVAAAVGVVIFVRKRKKSKKSKIYIE